MPHKRILFRSAAREKVLAGATQLTDAIRVTLGPRSKSVLIEKKWGGMIVHLVGHSRECSDRPCAFSARI